MMETTQGHDRASKHRRAHWPGARPRGVRIEPQRSHIARVGLRFGFVARRAERILSQVLGWTHVELSAPGQNPHPPAEALAPRPYCFCLRSFSPTVGESWPTDPIGTALEMAVRGRSTDARPPVSPGKLLPGTDLLAHLTPMSRARPSLTTRALVFTDLI